ncbi:hypothetical protein PAHAL_9G344400 [Panicum hallii]|uniref:Uncharacterized protein n=1 Tax=Panicum hallii TaxID=206008 RepID=A0A2S3IMS9_9POAL|nr:hypothetical protein PAHAL_9G344400 [Panicum hallii]
MNPARHLSLLTVVSNGSESGGSTGGTRRSQPSCARLIGGRSVGGGRLSQPGHGSSERISGAPCRVRGQGGWTRGPFDGRPPACAWTSTTSSTLPFRRTKILGCRIGGAGDAGGGLACCRGAGGGCRRWVCSGCGQANVGAACGR